MRILIVTQWFQPEPHFKGLAFAKALREMGHEVEVLTGFPNYPGGKVYPGYQVRLVQKEVMDGIRITRGYLYPSHDRSAMRRVANYVSFAFSSTILALARRRPDVVYVYTPPMTAALAPVLLRIMRGVPFVCDIQDMWPDTLAATGMVTNRRVLRLVGRWTDFALRRAARIVVLSDGFRRCLVERGIAAAKIKVVPNWAPPEIVEVARDLPALWKKPGQPGDARAEERRFTVLFAGNMGKAQGLDVVIDAATLLREQARDLHFRSIPVCFMMVGGGIEVERLKTRAATLGLDNIVFHEPRHPSQMGEVFAQADALLVHLRDDPLFEITIPSKTQAYLAVGKPILMGVRGDAAHMVAEAGAGVTFDPENPGELVLAIERLAGMSNDERHAIGMAGRRFYDEHLSFATGVAAIEAQLRLAAR